MLRGGGHNSTFVRDHEGGRQAADDAILLAKSAAGNKQHPDLIRNRGYKTLYNRYHRCAHVFAVYCSPGCYSRLLVMSPEPKNREGGRPWLMQHPVS